MLRHNDKSLRHNDATLRHKGSLAHNDSSKRHKRPAHDADLTLLYKFAVAKSLKGIDTLGPTLSLTRATIGTYFDSDGVLQTAASGEARFDHDPATGESLGLLVEEARTNIQVRSEEFDDAAWSQQNLTTITANATVAPDGNTTADKFIEDSTSGVIHGVVDTFTPDGSSQYTRSVFAKAAERDQCFVDFATAGFDNAANAFFDLSAGTIHSLGTGADSASIQDVGNGWYRCSVTATSDASASTAVVIRMAFPAGDQSYDGDGSSGMYFWGAQLELGAFPASYIPTTTTSVTRNRENVTTTDMSWLDAAATAVGTWYVKGSFPYVAASGNRSLLELSDGTTTDRFLFRMDSSEQLTFYSINSADDNGQSGPSDIIVENTQFQVASSYADDDVIMAMDGTLETADTTAGIPLTDNPTTLAVGQSAASPVDDWNGHIAEIRYYNVQKSDAFITSLSSGGEPE